MTTAPKPATTTTRARNQDFADAFDFTDRASFTDARKGFIATLDPMVITDDEGHVVWDLERFQFLSEDAPETVNPSLWRMAQLHTAHGLFKVIDGIYQIRGFDISNMTIITGDDGYIVIDPLTSAECAEAAMQLVRQQLGDRPVTAVIYTHSHADHFGGVKGIIGQDDVDRGRVRVIAPTGFMQHTVSENVYAGTAMNRRAQYMYGRNLPVDTTGMISTGLGIALSAGRATLLEPTDLITHSGQQLVLDGVRIEFQYTPDSEAPAEMHFYLPDFRALCMAENVSHHMHNLYTPRGAQIRDAAAWSDYIHEALQQYGDKSDVMFISHHWPVWGQAELRGFLAQQRDLYRYIHDETLRLAAHGYTPIEIAETVTLPEGLASCWASRGYYGTLNHNVKAVYQKYLGWFDANPANLHPHPPAESGTRYVQFMGGAESLLRQARESFEAGDYRWVAQVVNHLVFADPGNAQARELQADALEQLGYQAESAPWRNFYLTGAQDLRHGVATDLGSSDTSDLLSAMTTDMLLSYLAIRLNGPKAAAHPHGFYLYVTDVNEYRYIEVSNGVLIKSTVDEIDSAEACMTMTKGTLTALATGAATLDGAIDDDRVTVAGDMAAVREFFALLDSFEQSFNIVTP